MRWSSFSTCRQDRHRDPASLPRQAAEAHWSPLRNLRVKPFPRGTESSNQLPSGRQPVSLRISPPFQEKPGVSASLGTMPRSSVGRDAHRPATSCGGVGVSLSGYVPVPQGCRMRIAIERRWPRARLVVDLGEFEFGSAHAKSSGNRPLSASHASDRPDPPRYRAQMPLCYARRVVRCISRRWGRS